MPSESSRTSGAGPRGRDFERELGLYRGFLLAEANRLREHGGSDLVQATMAAALVKIREGRAPGPDERVRLAWLRVILRRAHLSWRRREASRPAEPLSGSVPDDGTSPSGRASRAERAERLRAGFERLAPEDQEVLRWRYVENLAVAEVAGRLGCSPSYASRVVADARGRLRAHLPAAYAAESAP